MNVSAYISRTAEQEGTRMGANDHDHLMFEVSLFKRSHPQVIISRPDECPSGMWEVSFPRSATIAFDNPRTMLECLSMVSVPDDEDE
jgi:hypothetical protein